MAYLLLLGGNKLNRGVADKFRERGYLVVVADWNEHPDLTGDVHVRVDVKDEAAVRAALTAAGTQIDFAYTSIDLAAPVALRLNLEANGKRSDIGDPMRFISKEIMTRRWKQAGLLNRVVRSYDPGETQSLASDFAEFAKIIVKPNIASSSRGITILGDEPIGCAFVQAAIDKARAESADGKIVAEEFVAGDEYTAEMIADADGQVTVYAVSIKAHSPYLTDNKVATKLLYNPADVERQKRVAEIAHRSFSAMKPSNCLGHMELILMNDDRISPLECGFRSSGFIASHLVDAACGRDYLGDYRRLLAGEVVPGVHVGETDTASMFYFYDLPPGATLGRAINICEHLPPAIRSLTGDRSLLGKGAIIPAVDNDNQRPGYEILVGPRDLLSLELVIGAERQMLKDTVQ